MHKFARNAIATIPVAFSLVIGASSAVGAEDGRVAHITKTDIGIYFRSDPNNWESRGALSSAIQSNAAEYINNDKLGANNMVNAQRTLRRIIKVTVLSVTAGVLLTCASIVIVGKKTHFSHCDYSGKQLNAVDRGAPFVYFKASPSISTCVAVENVGAVFASDVGNDVSFKALFADLAIWSAASAAVITIIHKKRK